MNQNQARDREAGGPHPTPGGESARTEYSGPVGVTTFRFGGQAVRLVRPADPDRLLEDPGVLDWNRRDDYMPYWAYLWPGAYLLAEAVAREESIGGIAPDGARTHESGDVVRYGRASLPASRHAEEARQEPRPPEDRTPSATSRRRAPYQDLHGARGSSPVDGAPDGARRAPYEDAAGAEGRGVAPLEALEIGCGLGLAGLVALARGLRVQFSDYDRAPLDFVGARRPRTVSRPIGTSPVCWTGADLPDERFPLILGADVIYEARLVPLVANVLAAMLAPGGVGWIASPYRVAAEPFPPPWNRSA